MPKFIRQKSCMQHLALVSWRFLSRVRFFVLVLFLGEQPSSLSPIKALLARDQVGLIPLGTFLGQRHQGGVGLAWIVAFKG